MTRSRDLQPWNFFNRVVNPIKTLMYAAVLFFVVVSSLEVIESHFLVKSLPGFDGDLPFTLETGYIGVGESEDVQLFYYFIESEGNPKGDPLMLWITGGPSCSSLSGLLYEIGPFTTNSANSTFEKAILALNPHSWTKVANIIFLDQPAGSGFSYAKTPQAYITNDTSSAIHAYNFLRKWLLDHPKFINNPLYVGGDSYMGILIPMIVQEIYNGLNSCNEVGEEPHMNFKGYVLGNPLTDTSGDYNSRIPFAHRMALLSDEIYKSAKENCDGEYLNVDPNNLLCLHDLQLVEKCLGRIYDQQILEPFCYLPRSKHQLQGCPDDNYLYSNVWANSRDVREALHIREEFENIEWVECNETLIYHWDKEVGSYTHDVLSTVGYHRRFAENNGRALIYSGDHDMLFPYFGTMKWIKSLNLSVVDDWRPWFVNKQVAGYTMKYSQDNYSLTYATVKGGGHCAPVEKPKECLSMFMRWLANDDL